MATIRRLTSEGRAGSGVPSAVVGNGGASEALAKFAGSLSGRLTQLAEDAAWRVGMNAGIAVGSAAGEPYTNFAAPVAVGDAGAAKAFLQQHSNKDASHTQGLDDNFSVKLASMFQAAPDDIRSGLGIYSGYRSNEHQARLWQEALAKYGSPEAARKWVAPPGRSQHNHGKASDLAWNGKSLKNAPAHVVNWVHENAAKFGLKFPLGNENWHIEDDSTRGGKGTLAPAADPSKVIDTRPLQLRRDGTIAGEAYDRAASSAYLWRMQAGVSNDLFQAQQQFQDDPNGFSQASNEIMDKYLQDPALADPQMREVFQQNFANRQLGYQHQITAEYGRRLKAEETAAFGEGVQALQVNIERQAYGYGANGDGDEMVGQMVTEAQAQIDAAVLNNTISPAAGETLKENIAITASKARIQGVYDSLPTPEAKEEFAASLVDKWIADDPEIGAYGDQLMSEIKGLSDTLRRNATDLTNSERNAFKAQAATIEGLAADDIASIAETGKGLDPADSGLDFATVERYLGTDAAMAWKQGRDKAFGIYDATSNMEAESAGEIATRLQALRKETEDSAGTAGYADRQDIYQTAFKTADTLLKERATDPLGQAGRAGVVDIVPIDPSTQEALSSSIAARQQQRLQVAALYQQKVPFFLPGEQARLSQSLMNNPEIIPEFSRTLIDQLGNDAVPVLAELSDQAPVIAHATALSLATGDTTIADEVSRALAMKQQKIYTVKMPSQSDQTAIALPEFGSAFIGQPRLQSAALQTAAILFEKAANEQGFDPSEIDKAGSVANDTYLKILDRVTGGRTVQGREFGGISEVNGSKIIVPPDIDKERPQQVMSNITAEQLAALPPIEAGDFPIPIAEIRNAHLVGGGDGIYRVALGDPEGDDPRYLIQPDGSAWTLDIKQLSDLQARQAAEFRAAREARPPRGAIERPADAPPLPRGKATPGARRKTP